MLKERIKKLTFEKVVDFDGKQHFVFQTEDGNRRVLEATGYESFRLQPGASLLARTRKRGCAGEEITELMHPFYVLGEVYPFKVTRSGSFQLNGETVRFVVVADAIGDEYKIRISGAKTYSSGDSVLCRLDEQTKGRLKFSI